VTTLDEALGELPAVRDRYRDLEAEVWAPGRGDPVLLELCRLRIADLLRDDGGRALRTPAAVAAGLSEDVVAELPRWPTSPAFGAAARAALAFAELFVIDAHAVTDDMCGALRAELGDADATALTIALAVFDAASRARALLHLA
jgi:alkylhydroperoxidase family enzyme